MLNLCSVNLICCQFVSRLNLKCWLWLIKIYKTWSWIIWRIISLQLYLSIPLDLANGICYGSHLPRVSSDRNQDLPWHPSSGTSSSMWLYWSQSWWSLGSSWRYSCAIRPGDPIEVGRLQGGCTVCELLVGTLLHFLCPLINQFSSFNFIYMSVIFCCLQSHMWEEEELKSLQCSHYEIFTRYLMLTFNLQMAIHKKKWFTDGEKTQ